MNVFKPKPSEVKELCEDVKAVKKIMEKYNIFSVSRLEYATFTTIQLWDEKDNFVSYDLSRPLPIKKEQK